MKVTLLFHQLWVQFNLKSVKGPLFWTFLLAWCKKHIAFSFISLEEHGEAFFSNSTLAFSFNDKLHIEVYNLSCYRYFSTDWIYMGISVFWQCYIFNSCSCCNSEKTDSSVYNFFRCWEIIWNYEFAYSFMH